MDTDGAGDPGLPGPFSKQGCLSKSLSSPHEEYNDLQLLHYGWEDSLNCLSIHSKALECLKWEAPFQVLGTQLLGQKLPPEIHDSSEADTKGDSGEVHWRK